MWGVIPTWGRCNIDAGVVHLVSGGSNRSYKPINTKMYQFEGILNYGRDVLAERKFKIAEKNHPAASRRLVFAAIAIMVILSMYVLLVIHVCAGLCMFVPGN